MTTTKLKQFLDGRGVKYVSLRHSPAVTATEIASSAHLAGRDFAKTVMVNIGHTLAMVVVPADRKIVLSDLREMLGHPDAKLASEAEFKDRFPDCELGAMPPFGNLYDLPVYVAQVLAEEPEIAFNAGTHREIVKMSFDDFVALVKPIMIDCVTT